MRLAHPPHRAREVEGARALGAIDRMANPAALGFRRKPIKPARNIAGRLFRERAIGQQVEIERARDRGLLDNALVHPAGERLDQPRHLARLIDQRAQIRARALRAVAEHKHRILDARHGEMILELALALEIDLALPTLHPIERWLRDIEVTLLHQLRHVAEEEGEKQCADVRAVDVGVRHDDDLVVAQLRQIEILLTDAGAERRDDGADLGRGEHLVEPGALDVQDLAAQGQDRLEAPVAPLLGRAAGRITLDEKQLAELGVALLAVRKLAREVRDVEHALAAREIARLARRLARDRGLDHLGKHRLGLARALLEPLAELLGDHGLDRGPHLGRHQLLLGLRGELGIGHLDREHRGEALARVITGQRHLLALGEPGRDREVVDRAGKRGAKAREVRAAIALADVVGEAQHGLVIAVVPLHGAFDGHAVDLALEVHDLRDQRLLRAIEIGGELGDATGIVQTHLPCLGRALVGEVDSNIGIEKRQLAEAMLERLEIELGFGEGRGRGQEGDLGAVALARRLSHLGQRRHRVAEPKAHIVLLALAPDAQVQPLGERVHHRDADAVQTARHLVGVLVELTAGMEARHDHLGRRDTLLLVDRGRDATAVVAHRARAVGVQRDLHLIAIAGQGLVDRVVDDLIDHAVEARAVIGVTDVHAGPLAHRVEALEHLDRLRAIGFGAGHGVTRLVGAFGCISHEQTPRSRRHAARPESVRSTSEARKAGSRCRSSRPGSRAPESHRTRSRAAPHRDAPPPHRAAGGVRRL